MSVLDVVAWACKLAIFAVLEMALLVTGLGVFLIIFFGIVDFVARRRRRQA